MAENPAIVLQPPAVSVFVDGDLTGSSGNDGGRIQPGNIGGFSPSSHRFWEIPPVTPTIGERHLTTHFLNKRILYVNGINTPRAAHAYTIKLISVVTGAVVVGIYNQSGDGGSDTDIVADLLQCLGDKTGLGTNPATDTLMKTVFDACINGISLNIVAHSQGAIITSRGIRNAIRKLINHYARLDDQLLPYIKKIDRQGINILGSDGIDRIKLLVWLRERIEPMVEDRLNKFVSVQTFGGASRFFPDGPRYRHVFNHWDPVSTLFGQGDIITGPGRGAKVEKINRNAGMMIRDFEDHSMDKVYLQDSQHYVDRNGTKVDHNYIPIDVTMLRY